MLSNALALVMAKQRICTIVRCGIHVQDNKMPRPSSSNGAAADVDAYEAAVSSAIARLAEEVRLSATAVVALLQVMGLLPTHCCSAES